MLHTNPMHQQRDNNNGMFASKSIPFYAKNPLLSSMLHTCEPVTEEPLDFTVCCAAIIISPDLEL